MRRIVKNSWFAVILLTWGMICFSCEDWTDPESIYNRQIKKFPTEKQNVSLKHILT